MTDGSRVPPPPVQHQAVRRFGGDTSTSRRTSSRSFAQRRNSALTSAAIAAEQTAAFIPLGQTARPSAHSCSSAVKRLRMCSTTSRNPVGGTMYAPVTSIGPTANRCRHFRSFGSFESFGSFGVHRFGRSALTPDGRCSHTVVPLSAALSTTVTRKDSTAARLIEREHIERLR